MIIKNNKLWGVRKEEIKDGTFAFPDGITKIGGYAFDGCTSLTNIAIPNSVARS